MFVEYTGSDNYALFRIIEANKMLCFSTLFLHTTLHVSAGLTVHHQES